MSIIANNLLQGDEGYNISRSLRFRKSASAYLNRTPASGGNRSIWTYSAWVKRGALSGGTAQSLLSAYGGANDSGSFSFAFHPNDTLYVGLYSVNLLQTTAVYRDCSAYYHIVLSIDTSQATASNRAKLWVNGVEATSFSEDARGSFGSSYQFAVNTVSVAHAIGRDQQNSSRYIDGYITETNFIDGQALTPSSFGETDPITGVWKAKKYGGTYGTNGFFLDFKDNSSTAALGYDAAGSNDWTLNNISLTAGTTYDSMTDVPTLTSATTANYAVFNPVNVSGGGSTITDGNLACSAGSTSTYGKILSSIGMTTGKWYCEVTVTAIGSLGAVGLGDGTPPSGSTGLGGAAGELAYQSNGNKYTNASATAYGATYTTNDIIGIAYDASAGSVTFYKNNTSQGAITGLSGLKYFAVGSSGGTNPQYAVNFGQRPFSYTPPTGFVALNTFNLPEPSIKAGNKNFNAVTYTGNGTAGKTVTGVGFQPDFTWIKSRSDADSHYLVNNVAGYTKYLLSNSTQAEVTNSNIVTSSDSDGFTVGSSGAVNGNTATYVAWNWKANGTGSSNTAGSITSTVSANPTAGFSVVTYTGNGSGGATVGHGLGVAPKMIIVKRRDSGVGATNWPTYHANLNGGVNPAQYHLFLNLTNAQGGSSVIWNDTAPTSSVFSLGTYSETNGSGGTFVAYCFAPVSGYSAMGSYTGNGSTDGVFVHLGFKPKFILWKRTNTTGDWTIIDSARDTYNYADKELFPNLSDAETVIGGGLSRVDILSNGFKVRGADSYQNASGSTYIYYAVAENPFKYSLGR